MRARVLSPMQDQENSLGLHKFEELEIRARAKPMCPKALGSSKEVCNYLDQQVEKKNRWGWV